MSDSDGGRANWRAASIARARRAEFFPSDLFGEPAWDILLDLHAAAEANDLRSIKSACLSLQVPEATALRYIDLPAAQGLVERKPDRTDKRRKYLTPHHRQASARCMITWRRCGRWRPGRGI